MYILAPSLLAADFNILGKQIKETEEAGAEYLHIDVMITDLHKLFSLSKFSYYFN